MSTQVSASIVANRMYAFGETYAQAKAWALANLAADATGLDAVQADITTLGGQALAARVIAWYSRETLFADLPASSANLQTVPGLSLAGHDGDVVTVVDGAFALGAGGGGGGLTGVGAFDTTPNADGLSVTVGDVSLSLADDTNPGGISPDDPAFSDGFTSTSGGLFTGTPVAGDANGVMLGADGAFNAPCVWLGTTDLAFSKAAMYVASGVELVLNSLGGVINFQQGGVTKTKVTSTQLDCTGLGNGAEILLKSPDGTTYTLSIANGGTLLIT